MGGSFTTVNGQARNRFAAFTIATGALTSWNPNASGNGYAITPTANGSLAEVATYPAARPAATVTRQWAAGSPGAIGASGG